MTDDHDIAANLRAVQARIAAAARAAGRDPAAITLVAVAKTEPPRQEGAETGPNLRDWPFASRRATRANRGDRSRSFDKRNARSNVAAQAMKCAHHRVRTMPFRLRRARVVFQPRRHG